MTPKDAFQIGGFQVGLGAVQTCNHGIPGSSRVPALLFQSPGTWTEPETLADCCRGDAVVSAGSEIWKF